MSVKSFVERLRDTSVTEVDERDLIQLLDDMEGKHYAPDMYAAKCLAKLLLNEVYGHQHKINKRDIKLKPTMKERSNT